MTCQMRTTRKKFMLQTFRTQHRFLILLYLFGETLRNQDISPEKTRTQVSHNVSNDMLAENNPKQIYSAKIWDNAYKSITMWVMTCQTRTILKQINSSLIRQNRQRDNISSANCPKKHTSEMLAITRRINLPWFAVSCRKITCLPMVNL